MAQPMVANQVAALMENNPALSNEELLKKLFAERALPLRGMLGNKVKGGQVLIKTDPDRSRADDAKPGR
jgi:hypothetical protein